MVTYPAISAFIADYTSTKVIVDYQAKFENKQKQEIGNQYDNIKTFQKNSLQLVDNPFFFYKKKYETEKKKPKKTIKTEYNIGEMEGYITIPNIDVALPIYEGTKDNVLYKGAGHLIKTSLPGGGKGTHCVITGHSGLSSATLFTDLEKLIIGDDFYINSNNKLLKYKIDRITVIKPYDVDKYIRIDNNKDYCTLITCTPITINTHRLLVRGERIPYDGKDKEVIYNKMEKQNYIISFIALLVYIFILNVCITYKLYKKKTSKN